MFERLKKIKASSFLKNSTTQRLVNAGIFLFLACYHYSLWKELDISSNMRFHLKAELLQILVMIFFIQILLNKTYVNSFLMLACLLLIGYFIYSYLYFFVDDHDWYKQNFGKDAIRIKTIELFIKILIVLFALVILFLIRPDKKNAINKAHLPKTNV